MRAQPDDLLLIAGYGLQADDEVIYEAVSDTTVPQQPPGETPKVSDGRSGVAPIVSRNLPYALTVRLPAVMRAEQSYVLWVRSAAGEWSKGLLINDARPLWISPSFVYASATAHDAAPRELKVIGRNLQPGPAASTHVRLTGPEIIERIAQRPDPGAESTEALDRYVARVNLPTRVRAGRYRVAVSRDGRSWVDVRDQTLEVRDDPSPLGRFRVDDPRFGSCHPNDDRDDTVCIVNAIAAAAAAGGGVVEFPAGTWDLVQLLPAAGASEDEGILVPDRVSLEGAGPDLTRLRRHAEWGAKHAAAAFTLEGHATISGFTFTDLKRYSAADRAGAFLQLGQDFSRAAAAGGRAAVDELVITRNRFDKTFIAIVDGGLPIHRLFVTHNEFGAYFEALRMTGNRFNMVYPFRIDESVIAYNVFKPGSMLDTAEKTGAMASELGAGFRVDFSDNRADGSAVDFLYEPADARGWAAAFFWNMNNNVEEVLVAGNQASCTGDKIGDGPGISFDNNANTFAFSTLAPVARATASTVEVAASLMSRQNLRDVPVGTYYAQHWIVITSGPGRGQVRKVSGYAIDQASGNTVFGVMPDWDVVPVSGESRIAAGREYWQVYAVANEIDHRRPLCEKSNRSRHGGGGIGLWAQSADSVIEGNRQYDTDGILIQQSYEPPQRPCPDCGMQGFFQYFLEIRANSVDGEYDWAIDCSASGIGLGIAAAPWFDAIPPTVGYGNSVSHNRIRRADAEWGGAIAQIASWYSGPEPFRWPLEDNLLIHHNKIEHVAGPEARAACTKGVPRMGITFPDKPTSWRTVLYRNSCDDVSIPLQDRGVQTVKVCDSSPSGSCECR